MEFEVLLLLQGLYKIKKEENVYLKENKMVKEKSKVGIHVPDSV